MILHGLKTSLLTFRYILCYPQMTNSNVMMGFLLTEFSEVWELQVLHAITFSVMLGNTLIVTVTTLDRSLHTPMYFFLRNLFILDACYISVTVPNSCINSLLDSSTISKAGCKAEVFLVVFFVYTELLFLTLMAQDHYVSIRQPLYYSIIMNSQNLHTNDSGFHTQ